METSDQRLSRNQRLTRSVHFRETFDQQRRYAGRTMVLWLRRGEGAALRLGVVASRTLGNAVARNRAKRLLRETYRRHRGEFRKRDVDIVLVGRRAILATPWPQIGEDLMALARKAGLL